MSREKVLFIWPHGGCKVLLAGEWNKWKGEEMEYKDKEWKMEVQLKPGHYAYKYIVDGNWYYDIL